MVAKSLHPLSPVEITHILEAESSNTIEWWNCCTSQPFIGDGENMNTRIWVELAINSTGSLDGCTVNSGFGLVTTITGQLLCWTSANENNPWSITATRYLFLIKQNELSNADWGCKIYPYIRFCFQSASSNSNIPEWWWEYIWGTIPMKVWRCPHK